MEVGEFKKYIKACEKRTKIPAKNDNWVPPPVIANLNKVIS